MNLNRLGSGRKLIDQISNKGNNRNMGWTYQQQQKLLDTQKNPHNPRTRNIKK
jgi:hypothetical protein